MVGVSTGLEPYFSFSYFRSGRLGKFIEVKADIVQEYLDKHPEAEQENLPNWFVSKHMLMYNVSSSVGLTAPSVKQLMHQKAIALNK
jgi:ribonucleotide reductase alpha subunit